MKFMVYVPALRGTGRCPYENIEAADNEAAIEIADSIGATWLYCGSKTVASKTADGVWRDESPEAVMQRRREAEEKEWEKQRMEEARQEERMRKEEASGKIRLTMWDVYHGNRLENTKPGSVVYDERIMSELLAKKHRIPVSFYDLHEVTGAYRSACAAVRRYAIACGIGPEPFMHG